MDLVINKLPAPTWNRLGMNETVLKDVVITDGNHPVVRLERNGAEIIKIDYKCGSYENLIPIEVAPYTKKTIIIAYTSADWAEGLSSIKTKVALGEGSELRLMELQLLGNGFTHINNIQATLGKQAKFELLQLELGAAKAYAEVITELVGEQSDFQADLGFYGRKEQVLDINYVANHYGKKTNCNMVAEGVLSEAARKIFRGTIDFKNGCSGSTGSEQESVLLLTDDVVNQSIPLILCAEEDVQGNHGASIGKLDEDMLFYLRSRGFSEAAATNMMAKAKIEALSRKLEDEETLALLEEYLEGIVKDAN